MYLFRRPAEARNECFDLIRIPPQYDPVEWILERKAIILPARGNAFPGPLRLRPMTPYLEAPLRAFTNRKIEHIGMCCGRQVGKTTAIIALLGYIIDYAPAPTMLLLPTEDLCKSMSKDRIRPIIFDSPILARHLTNSPDDFAQLAYTFDNCTIRLQHSGGRVGTRSKPICNLLEDEVSAIESRAVLDAEETTTTFWNRRIFKTTTPVNRHDNIWRYSGLKPKDDSLSGEVMWDTRMWKPDSATTCYFYNVPCPRCGQYITLQWPQIRWDKDVAIRDISRNAWYECQECGGRIENSEKEFMLNAGEWKTENPGGKWIFFHLSSLYSPFENASFGAVANKGLRARLSRDPDVVQEFLNNWLALPYSIEEEAIELVPAEALQSNMSGYKRNTIPDGVRALTVGIDVGSEMGSKIHWYMSGWGAEELSWRIAWGVFDSLDELGYFLTHDAFYTHPAGAKMTPLLGGIDCGWNKSAVVDFCKRQGIRGRIFPVQGMQVVRDRMNQRSILRHRFFNAEKDYRGRAAVDGLKGLQVNVTYWKEWLYARLARLYEREACYFFPSDGRDAILQRHLTSEKEITERAKGGKPAKKRWVVKEGHEANHYLDAAVYDAAIADAAGLLRLTPESVIKTGVAEEGKKRESDPAKANPHNFPRMKF